MDKELKLIKKEYGIFDKGGYFFADSKKISKIFSKRHDNVLRSIENLVKNGCSKEFFALNFKVTFKKNKSGRSDKMYYITKDGFVMLTMGFTGKQAMAFKEIYINKFNQYEEYYKSRQKLKMESTHLTDSIKNYRELQGKEVKPFHYSNEYNMINKIVLGMNAKQFKQKHNIDENIRTIRDYLTIEQINLIEDMQHKNAVMIELDMDYETRKKKLSEIFQLKGVRT
jgi:Rha family phage regulatory protein